MRTWLLPLIAALAACGSEENPGDKDFECQATCTNSMGQPSQGFESYTIEDAVDEAEAVERCKDQAEPEPEVACGAGNSFAGGCVCSPRS